MRQSCGFAALFSAFGRSVVALAASLPSELALTGIILLEIRLVKRLRPIREVVAGARYLDGIPGFDERAPGQVRVGCDVRRRRAARRSDHGRAATAHFAGRGAGEQLARDLVSAQDRPQAKVSGRSGSAGAHPPSPARLDMA